MKRINPSLILSALLPIQAQAQTPILSPHDFERYEIDIGPTPRQTVLTGDLTEDGLAEIVIFHLDKSKTPYLRVFSFEESDWKLRQETTLPRHISIVDIVRQGKGEHLLGYGLGKISWLGERPNQAVDHLAVTSTFNPPRPNELPHVDMTHDVNADGREDLLVPTPEGYWIAIQNHDQTFAPAIQVGTPPDLSGIYGADGYRFDPWLESLIYSTDFNQDGRVDLVFWRDGKFQVHFQDHDGQFSPTPTTYPAPSRIQTNDPHSLATPAMTGSALITMSDLNQDGITDLVIATLEGLSISRKRSRYQIHYGIRSADGGTRFSETASVTFKAKERIYIDFTLCDLDQKGSPEFLLTSIPKTKLTNSWWKQLKGLMGDDIKLTLDFYQSPFTPEEPNYSCTIALDGFPSHQEPGYVPLRLLLRGATHIQRKKERMWPRAFNPTLLLGDITGDGHSELLTSSHPRELTAAQGIANSKLFTERRQSIRVDMPNDGEYAWLAELNNDDKLDLVLHRTFVKRDAHGGRKQAPGTESQQLEILLSR